MNRKLCIAPMMGCTDRPCRFLFRLLSKNAMLYSEMITTGALLNGNRQKFLEHETDNASAVQLGGNKPAHLAQAAKIVEDAGYQEVNFNCGCPSDRVKKGGIGACLMGNPSLVAACYEAMANAVSIPVTIKTRIGIDNHDDYSFFNAFIHKIYVSGCRHFQIHARKAILSGLTPKENREIPPLNYDFVRKIQQEYPDAEFILNGGIKTLKQAQDLLTEFSGVMLGRAAYSEPFLLTDLEQQIFGTPAITREKVLDTYLRYMEKQMQRGVHLKHMAKHLLGFFSGIPGARAFRRHLSNHMHEKNPGIGLIHEAAGYLRSDTHSPLRRNHD